MATEIRATPVLYGKDAKTFLKRMKIALNNPVSAERLQEIKRSADIMKSILVKSKI